MRSLSHPQSMRLRKAAACRTDSIAAPCTAAIPRSLQNATRWPCGNAIGTQQQKPAMLRIASTTLGRSPSTTRLSSAVPSRKNAVGTSGGRCRNRNAIGGIATSMTTAQPIIVARQP